MEWCSIHTVPWNYKIKVQLCETLMNGTKMMFSNNLHHRKFSTLCFVWYLYGYTITKVDSYFSGALGWHEGWWSCCAWVTVSETKINAQVFQTGVVNHHLAASIMLTTEWITIGLIQHCSNPLALSKLTQNGAKMLLVWFGAPSSHWSKMRKE